MHRLTRELRFSINPTPDDQLTRRPTNSFGGFPTMTGLGRFYTLRVTLAGPLDPESSYLRNIREIDQVIRQRAIPMIAAFTESAESLLCDHLFTSLQNAWPGATLDKLELLLTPLLSLSVNASEFPMIRLTQRFEFSASHRLHNPTFSEEENRRRFGKCNNPQGHGHNYELAVTLAGEAAGGTLLKSLPDFERIVQQSVIDRFDHKNLNAEVPEFRDLIPTVENIAMIIYRLLAPAFGGQAARLAAVTVWETPKTWCEYSE